MLCVMAVRRKYFIMQIELFNVIVEKLSSSLYLSDNGCEIAIYRFYKQAWYDGLGNVVAGTSQIVELDKTFGSEKVLRFMSGKKLLVPFNDLEIVVGVVMRKIIRTSLQKKIEIEVSRCFDNAKNAFNSAHDLLTGLYNRAEIRATLFKSLDRMQKHHVIASGMSTSIPVSGRLNAVCVFALDIDFFKQVNDTHGHLYGDVVLKCIAIRGTYLLKQIKEQYRAIKLVEFARPSGEEFIIILEGEIDLDLVGVIAQKLLYDIGAKPLPSKEEWDSVREPSVSLPIESERKITVSIGVSNLISVVGDEVKNVTSQLLSEADAALLRAKKGGRNTYRIFEDILKKHGKVLEFHCDTKIVTIDIGSDVGVQIGQEFKVYHPQFCGNSPFIYNDGRTQKILGNYPRHQDAVINVFEVQSDISFCRINENSNFDTVKEGAGLESISLGSFSHFLNNNSSVGVSLSTDIAQIEDIGSKIKTEVERESEITVAVFAISEFKALYKERGQSHINKTLAVLYENIKKYFLTDTLIGLSQDNEIVIATTFKVKDIATTLQVVISEATTILHGISKFYCGYSRLSTDYEKDGYENYYNPLHLLNYAKYAIAVANPDDPIVMYCEETVSKYFKLLHSEGKREKILDDYINVVDIGINIGSVHNIASLVKYMNHDFELALVYVDRAIRIEGNEPIYHCNKAVYLFLLDRYGDAFVEYRKSEEINKRFIMPKTYLASCFIAAIKASVDDENIEYIKQVAIKLQKIEPENWYWCDSSEVKRELIKYTQPV